MKWRKAVIAAVLLAVPVWAWAQSIGTDGSRNPGQNSASANPPAVMVVGGIMTDTTFRALRLDANGYLQMVETAPIYGQNLTFTSIINNTTGLALGGADSSIVLDTHAMRLGTLLIKPTLSGTGTVDTTCVARLAIQIRTHLNNQSDSSSVFSIYQYGVVPAMTLTSATAAQPDTAVVGHIYSALPLTAITATPSATTTWSGEFEIILSAKRNAHGSGVDVNGHTFYYPNGIAIPLQSIFGRDIYSPYTSVRIRLMTFQKGAASLAGGTVIYTVHLVGTPL